MKKTVLSLLFYYTMIFMAFSQKEFKISNGQKSKMIKQTDYFTFHLRNSLTQKKNIIDEGYILKSDDGHNYHVGVFLLEYIANDSLIIKTSNAEQTYINRINIRQDDIIFFQHNKRAKISAAKVMFGLSLVSLLSTSYFAGNQTLFDKNGITNSQTQAIVVGSSLGIASLSFTLGMKFINPKKYYSSKLKKKGGWAIFE